MSRCSRSNSAASVAPFAGAWIEITAQTDKAAILLSLPSRERGLKYNRCTAISSAGLVAPFAGAWIEM